MYETGIGFAFLLWIVGNAIWIAERFSLRTRNLKKVGLRLSVLGGFQPATDYDLRRSPLVSFLKWLIISGLGLVLTLFSWAYVVAFASGWVWNLSRQAGAPAEVRELRWRLRNVDMSFDDVLRALLKAQGRPIEDLDGLRAATLQDMRDRGLA